MLGLRNRRSAIRVTKMDTSNDPQQLARWASTWRDAAVVLEEERKQRLRQLDTAVALASLKGPIRDAVQRHPPQATSGLIELRRLLDGWAQSSDP